MKMCLFLAVTKPLMMSNSRTALGEDGGTNTTQCICLCLRLCASGGLILAVHLT